MPSAGLILRHWFEEVWNQKDASRMADYIAPECVLHSTDMAGSDLRGPAAFQIFFDQVQGNFSDVQFTVHDVVEQGDRAAGRWTARMTHTGDGFGVPATGRSVTISGMSMVRVEDGKVAEAWDEWDRFRLATTCGMVARV
ncbi:ester cyclase [Roseomonas marmotae]|uniref:Ester cyclase n=1 Tax=Roseomonas marmotae TaxID=2768161 RepID=A0ABS3KGX8_9PROT|nr:ester cyclase [Roseomonas marmotae]MBO1076739.1 ester cyclase [Roseomonas marmotae]QTI77983.1 ester cyclase [Roseomonas marmotae]